MATHFADLSISRRAPGSIGAINLSWIIRIQSILRVLAIAMPVLLFLEFEKVVLHLYCS